MHFDMSFDFYLYRAVPGLGSLLQWQEDHAEPLGSPGELRDRISSLFPSLSWQEQPDGSLAAQGTDDSADPRELSLRASSENGQVQFVVTYASPPILRKLMVALRLNYCCAPESGELRDPFAVAEGWGTERPGRHGFPPSQ